MSRDEQFSTLLVTGVSTIPSTKISERSAPLPRAGSLVYNVDDASLYISRGPAFGWMPAASGVIAEPVLITSTLPSTSPTSGALVVDGGVGIGGSVFIGGNLSVNGSFSAVNVAATELSTTTLPIVISLSPAPIAGQVLTATSATNAIWQNPSGTTSATGLITTTDTVNVSNSTAPTTGQVLTATSDSTAIWENPNEVIEAIGLLTTSTTVNVSAASAPTVGQVLTATSGSSAVWQDQIYQGILPVANGGTGDSTLTLGNVLIGNGTSVVTTSKAAPTGAFVGLTDIQSLTNKTITGASGATTTNNVTVSGLFSSSSTVNVSSSSAPSAGQVLVATSSTDSSWQNISSTDLSGNLAVANGGTGVNTLTLGNVLVGNGSSSVQTTKIAPGGAFVGTTDIQTLTNKTLLDGSINIASSADQTKETNVSLGAMITGTELTLSPLQTTSQTLSVPNITGADTLVTNSLAQSLTNKNITDSGSNVNARGLNYDGNGGGIGTVNVYTTVAAPSAGQVLTAINGTAARWQAAVITSNASGLASATTTVNVSAAIAPTVGQVLTAISPTSAIWQAQSETTAATALVTTSTDVNVSSATAPTAGQVLTATSGTAATWQSPTYSGVLPVSNGGTGDATLTSGNVLVGAGTAPVTATKVAPAGNFVGTSDSQTLTNKNITDTGSNVTASSLFSASTTVSVTATAPTIGQALTATSGTAATWQTPSAAGLSGIVLVANGGTGDSTLTLGNVLIGNGTSPVTTSKAAPAGDFVGTSDSQILTNKNVTDTGSVLTASNLFAGTTTIDVGSSSAPTAGQILTVTSVSPSYVASWQSLSNVYDGTFVIENTSDNTKQLNFSLGGMTTGVDLTLAAQQSTSQTLTFPNITAADTVVGANTIQTLTHKIITGTSGSSTTNNVTANSIYSSSGVIDVSSATAPTAGQVLIASSGTTSIWNTLYPATETTWSVPRPALRYTGTAGNNSQNFVGAMYRLPSNVTASYAFVNSVQSTVSSQLTLGLYQTSDGTARTSAWSLIADGTFSLSGGTLISVALSGGQHTFKAGWIMALWANNDGVGEASGYTGIPIVPMVNAYIGASTVIPVFAFTTGISYSAVPPSTITPTTTNVTETTGNVPWLVFALN